MHKYEQLVNAFENGEELTVNQIRARYKIANPTAVITHLRKDGYAIYLNQRTNALGEKVGKYRLGKATRKVIAAGYAALGAAAFA